MNPSIEYLWPDQILALARGSGIALIPVSPLVEWHSYHLPMGVDGLIAEYTAAELAQQLNAAWFRTISLGLDEVRIEAFKRSQGLNTEDHIFGMNYPSLSLESEYVGPETLQAMMGSRLRMAQAAGFSHLFIINHHDGTGQMENLEAVDWGHRATHSTIAPHSRRHIV